GNGKVHSGFGMYGKHQRVYGSQCRQAAGLLRYSFPLRHQYLLHCTFLCTSQNIFAWIPVFLIADSISWGIKRTYSGSSTCINRTAAMTGWLTGFTTDAYGPKRCRQTDA